MTSTGTEQSGSGKNKASEAKVSCQLQSLELSRTAVRTAAGGFVNSIRCCFRGGKPLFRVGDVPPPRPTSFVGSIEISCFAVTTAVGENF